MLPVPYLLGRLDNLHIILVLVLMSLLLLAKLLLLLLPMMLLGPRVPLHVRCQRPIDQGFRCWTPRLGDGLCGLSRVGPSPTLLLRQRDSRRHLGCWLLAVVGFGRR